MVPKRRPVYFLLEPLALVVAMGAGALLLIHSFTKRAIKRSGDQEPQVDDRNSLLKSYWPLLLAAVMTPLIALVIVAAPGLSATVFPIAILAVLSFGVVMYVRRSFLGK